jgi:hypothetical protein
MLIASPGRKGDLLPFKSTYAFPEITTHMAGWCRSRPVGSAISRRDSVPADVGRDHIVAPTRFLFWTLREPNSYGPSGKSQTSRQGRAEVCASPPTRSDTPWTIWETRMG